VKKPKEEKRPGVPPARQNLLRYAGLGAELAAAIVGLTLTGLWVDYHFHTRPVGVVVGASLGVIGGLYNFLRDAWRMSRPPIEPSEGQGERRNDDGSTPG
jgi:F0F1-type ATP synthase assembly protein I